ncbi:MAG: hypothetical protein NTX25_14195, partial [Proteobacteria bacterium]|nr:hypothetical protein [Pseudomonadota bacterium]
MKKLLTLGFASCLSSVTWAASAALPADPNVCAESIAEKGYCVESDVPFSGPFTLRFFVVVDKENYPTVDNLLDQYLSFDKWPSYTETVGSDTILFNKSVRMSDLKTASGEVIARQYYDYKLKSPIGYQKVRGVTHNKRLATPYAGSLATIEFVAQIDGPQDIPAGEKALDGAEGVRSQTGVI